MMWRVGFRVAEMAGWQVGEDERLVAEQSAGKGLALVRTPEKHPSGLKATLILRHLRHD
jgi:hypothetical protein